MDNKFKDSKLKIFTKVGCDSFVTHLFNDSSIRDYGVVYPITYWTKFETKESGWSYNSASSGGETHDHLNNDCEIYFEFIFCWKGVWEGRIYFPDDAEYWSEDLRIIADVWDQVEANLKQRIKLSNPDYEGFDD